MSRSEHATRRNPGDPGDIPRKREIKRLVSAERERVGPALPVGSPEAVPIVVREGGACAHLLVTERDLRALMARLPPGVCDGVGSVSLCPNECDDPVGDPDPLVGGPHIERPSGVHAPRILGRYRHDGARIELYAYVYEPSLPMRVLVETLLRIETLSTFVHEIAHHHDLSTRVARGRWIAEHERAAEDYAEALQEAWTREHVVPYIEEVYGDEAGAMLDWIEAHGGCRVTLDALAEPLETVPDRTGFRRHVNLRGAVEELLGAVNRGAPPDEARVTFARYLHFSGHNEDALAALATVRVGQPEHRESLTEASVILASMGRLDEAESLATRVVTRHSEHVEAWSVLEGIALARQRWTEVVQIATRILDDLKNRSPWQARESLERRARALIELGDLAAADRDLRALSERASGPVAQRALAHLRSMRAERG